MLRSENPTRPTTIEELLSSQLIAKISQLDVSSRKIFAGKLKGERRSKKRGRGRSSSRITARTPPAMTSAISTGTSTPGSIASS